ncbi:hypothetical protein D0C16_15570 [Cellvibrio sp. KY-GH-1]|nr:hypothetical protein D0C16_15570 [Cellvibrio sp. KY-GH-1]
MAGLFYGQVNCIQKLAETAKQAVILVLFSSNSIILALKNMGGLLGALAGLFSAIGQVQTQSSPVQCRYIPGTAAIECAHLFPFNNSPKIKGTNEC